MADNVDPISKPSLEPVPDHEVNDDTSPTDSDTPPHCYSTDPVWDDVIPIEQKEGPFPVVRIAYSKVDRVIVT